MAQWPGMWTNRSHESRVHDAEVRLLRAARVYAELEPHEREGQVKVLHRLAAKVLTARLQSMRSEIRRKTPLVNATETERFNLKSLRTQYERSVLGRVTLVLEEFGLAGIFEEQEELH